MLADFLAGFMKQAGVAKASLVGNSMGASVATMFAVHYPHMVDKLVLVDGAGYRGTARSAWPTAAELRRRQIQNASTLAETREFWKILWHDDSRITDEMIESAYATRLRAAYAIGKMQEAGDMGRGGVTEEEMRDIQGSRTVIMDNAGHMPQLERPDEFNRIVRDFLKGTPASTQR